MTAIYWTTEEDATLTRLRAESMPYKQIGALLGRTDKSLAARIRILRNGVPPGRKQVLTLPEVKEYVVQAFEAGIQNAAISSEILARFGHSVHPDTVGAMRRKLKPAPRLITVAPDPKPAKTEIEFADWVIRKKEWPVKRLDQNGVPSGYVTVSLAGGMVPA